MKKYCLIILFILGWGVEQVSAQSMGNFGRMENRKKTPAKTAQTTETSSTSAQEGVNQTPATTVSQPQSQPEPQTAPQTAPRRTSSVSGRPISRPPVVKTAEVAKTNTATKEVKKNEVKAIDNIKTGDSAMAKEKYVKAYGFYRVALEQTADPAKIRMLKRKLGLVQTRMNHPVDAVLYYNDLYEEYFKGVVYPALWGYGNALYSSTDPIVISEAYQQLYAVHKGDGPDAAGLAGMNYDDILFLKEYGDALLRTAGYEMADTVFRMLYATDTTNEVVKIRLQTCKNGLEFKYSDAWLPWSKVVDQKEIGTSFSEYGATIVDGKLVFTSAKRGKPARTDYRTSNDFSHFYIADYDNVAKTWINPRLLSLNLVDEYCNDGSFSYDPKLKRAYFMRCNQNDCQLYTTDRDGDDWTTPERMIVNEVGRYSVGHPSISPDGKKLLFVSKAPNGEGDLDIYMTTRIEKKASSAAAKKRPVRPTPTATKSHNRAKGETNPDWTVPVNVGKVVNTSGKETFPTWFNDEIFFYSSDGHAGFGGLDLFYAKADSNGSFSETYLVEPPINTSFDDYNMVMHPAFSDGFYSSNRFTVSGIMDEIYSFPKGSGGFEVEGIIVADEDGKPLADVEVYVKPSNKEEPELLTVSDSTGHFFGRHRLDAPKYDLSFQKKRYFDKDTTLKFDTVVALVPIRYTKNYNIVMLPSERDTIEIEGLVLDPDMGDAIANVSVLVKRPHADGTADTVLVAKTDDYGYYHFRVAKDSTLYQIDLDKKYFNDSSYVIDLYTDVRLDTVLGFFSRYSKRVVNPLQSEKVEINGAVYDSAHQPLPDVAVNIYPKEALSGTPLYTATTAPDGTFKMQQRMDENPYMLTMSKRGYRDTTFDYVLYDMVPNLTDTSAEAPAMIPQKVDSRTFTADLADFNPDLTINGMVVDAVTKQPVPQAEIFLQKKSGEQYQFISTLKTDPNGHFTYPQTVDDSEYELTIGHPNYFDTILTYRLQNVENSTEGSFPMTIVLRPDPSKSGAAPAENDWWADLIQDSNINNNISPLLTVNQTDEKQDLSKYINDGMSAKEIVDAIDSHKKDPQTVDRRTVDDYKDRVNDPNRRSRMESLPAGTKCEPCEQKMKKHKIDEIFHVGSSDDKAAIIITDNAGNKTYVDLAPNANYELQVANLGLGDGEKPALPGTIKNTDIQKSIITKDYVMYECTPKLAELYDEVYVNNVYYDFDKSEVIRDGSRELDRLIIIAMKNPGMKFEISSHADERGGLEYNDKLTERRLAAVTTYLEKKGFDTDRLVAKAYGKRQPIIKNAQTDEYHALNRRTTFRLFMPKASNELAGTKYDLKEEKPSTAGLQFKVHAGAFREPLLNPGYFYQKPLNDVSGIQLSYFMDDDGFYKYSFGTFSKLDDARRLTRQVLNQGTECYVGAYYNGKRITVSEAQAIMNNRK